MHYSAYPDSNEPRSLRLAMGSFLAIAGLVYGLFAAVPQLQQSLTMRSAAQPMSWAELIQQGLSDNAHIQLTGVEISADDNQLLTIQKMVAELDPQGDRAAMQKKLVESLQGVDTLQLLQQSTVPLKVIPRGIDPDRVPAVIVMSRFDPSQTIGRAEVDTNSSLSGYVRKGWDLSWVEKALHFVGYDTFQLDDQQRPHYVISAVISVPDRNWSIGKVATCSCLVALGLVMAGSAGPSWLSWLVMPVPSLLSIVGFPLRYGRGGRLIRTLYMFIGLAGLIGGGYLAWYPGGMMQVGGDTLLQSLAFVAVSVGIASILGSRINARTARPRYRPEPNRAYKEPEQGFSIAKAAKAQIIEPVADDQYMDPRLSDASEAILPKVMDEQVVSLCDSGFGAPKQVMVHDEDRRNLTALMLGCHQIVLCEVSENGKSTLSRFVSVLSDGLVVVTLSASTPRVSPLRVGENGVYSRSRSDMPTEMLAEHLDRTVSIAEERRAQVVAMDEYERLDVFLLARRVLIDIQNEYDEAKRIVPQATYGRFSFPGRTVEQLVRN